MSRALFAPLLLMVIGCAQNSPVGTTDPQLAAAEARCEREATAKFPPHAQGMSGFFRTPNEYCEPTPGGLNCNIIRSGYLPQATSPADVNAQPRQQAFEQCMMAAGWRPDGAGMTAAPAPVAVPSKAAVRAARGWCQSHMRNVSRDDLDQCIAAHSIYPG
jgi:hypothetical protein